MSKTMDNRMKSDTEAGAIESETLTLVLWTHRPVGGDRTAVIDRLSSLRSEGQIDEFEIKTVPETVVLSRDDGIADRYDEFAQWAREANVSITPPFEHRTASSVVGREKEILTMPELCLAVYDDGLRGVYPCTRDGDRWSVTEYLDAFESGNNPPDPLPTDQSG